MYESMSNLTSTSTEKSDEIDVKMSKLYALVSNLTATLVEIKKNKATACTADTTNLPALLHERQDSTGHREESKESLNTTNPDGSEPFTMEKEMKREHSKSLQNRRT